MNTLGNKLLYFANGNGANGSTEAYAALGDNIAGVIPVTTTTTAVLFNKDNRGIDGVESKDKIVFTHDNTTTTSGHRCREIGKAIAEAANAGPHHAGMTDMVDLDNSIFYGNLSFITALAITLDV